MNGLNEPMEPEAEASGSDVVREQPQPDHATVALVGKLQRQVLEAKKHWEKTFRLMKWGQKFVKGIQWAGQGENDERYVANVVQRHVNQRTASLYAKNPRFFYKRRRTLDFAVWDGTQKTIQEAMQAMQVAQQAMATGDPALVQQMQVQLQPTIELMQDIAQGTQKRKLHDRIGKTMEILAEHELLEQKPPFKKQMKQLIRRVLSCKVGYVSLGYERELRQRPQDEDKIRDYTQQLARLEQLAADYADDQLTECQAQMEELRLMLEQARNPGTEIVREGLVVDFPPSTRVIPDPRMRQLQGFIGCQWVAEEFALSYDFIQQTWGIDLRKAGGTMTDNDRAERTDLSGLVKSMNWSFQSDGDTRKQDGECLVWRIQDKSSGLVYTIAEGYPDFLEPPKPPEVKLERFWTIFPLTFNDAEDEDDPFPMSDAELLKHIQIERNRSREGLREHRIAARPLIATRKGVLTDEDKEKLMEHPPMAVVELEGLADGDDVGKILQNVQKPGIDPGLYSTDFLEQDLMMTTGSQEANLGGVSGGTATESSIAESSRMSSVGSNIDDLDDFLNEIAHATGQILLANMSADTVREIVGPGAVWPELSADEIAKDLILEVEAGSSGRPNRAAEIANFERITPLLLQIPGISPSWLAERGIRILDDKTNLEDAIIEGLPPISAMAAAMGSQLTPQGGGATAGADSSKNPSAQGAQGGNNAERPDGSQMNSEAMNPGAGPDIQRFLPGQPAPM